MTWKSLLDDVVDRIQHSLSKASCGIGIKLRITPIRDPGGRDARQEGSRITKAGAGRELVRRVGNNIAQSTAPQRNAPLS
jgi:hypothetical protein